MAGHQQLGSLNVIWDDNKISIEDDTNIAFTEDVAARYEAYGWHVQRVDWLKTGDYQEDVDELARAVDAARAETSKPSLICLRTVIGWPAPNKQNTGGVHGSALGADEVAATKEFLGADPEKHFHIDDDVLAHAREVTVRGRDARAAWEKTYHAWREANPKNAELLDRLESGRLPEGWEQAIPEFPVGEALATRAASGKVINAIAPVLPELWGGSADLAGSNNTLISGEDSFGPSAASTGKFNARDYGRNLHFGVREHAAAAITNGVQLSLRCGRTTAPSSSSRTTSAPPSDWRPSWAWARSSCGPTTRSDSARTGPHTSRSSSWHPSAPFPDSMSCVLQTRTRWESHGAR